MQNGVKSKKYSIIKKKNKIMNTEERIELYKRAINAWGTEPQIKMVMEETGEMLSALAKHGRNRSTNEEVITELVDVWILMEQKAVNFGYEEFEKEKEYKLQRLKERLDKNKSL